MKIGCERVNGSAIRRIGGRGSISFLCTVVCSSYVVGYVMLVGRITEERRHAGMICIVSGGSKRTTNLGFLDQIPQE